MKLITKPNAIQNMFGGITISDVRIWSPSDDAGRTFEKLRTGKDQHMRIGRKYQHLVFESEGFTLYDVQAVESFGDDTFRCTVDKFAFHNTEE